MKLLRFGAPGQERPGILDAHGAIRDLSGVVEDIAGEVLSDAGLDRLRGIDPESLPRVDGDPRLGPCVAGVGKFLGIGLNYADHAAETGMDLPEEPIVFAKATSCIVGPNDDVQMPKTSDKLDWEVELGVIIGTRAKNVSEAEALNHVAGYCVVNDVSERAFQAKRSGQWTKGKSHDGFGPIGPWLVTRDEVPDPQNLAMYTEVNGHRYQDGSTKTMHFGVATIVAHLSEFMTLHPGDVIATGTPPGVGMGLNPRVFLKIGDVMELSVAGLGVQRQTVVRSE
ncbi:FAA hydrolase family protein [Thalassococcus profundi]|uniref:FAA hydrolase family protein n=1 Tax=Thalassococcus profundi TaxID=2282382 RepID=A0A369TIK7_9RHOB|nr:fumarylacetoacetate hydrolase family protein [Thalassococcus profundi]RDD65108.1 FAA hydrolase family protein [Thalassococcus profundi]